MSNARLDETGRDPKQTTKQPNILLESMISEDGTLKFDFMTSLENIALAKISTILWMNRRHEIAELCHETVCPEQIKGYYSLLGCIKDIQDNIASRVRELHLPKSMAQKLRQVLPLTGDYIVEWIAFHDHYVFIPRGDSECIAVQLIGCVAWTARGRIDYAQTAKNILSDPDSCLTDDRKYKLACCSCLEDEIAAIAPRVAGPGYLDGVDFEKQPMVYLHTASITGDNAKLYFHIDRLHEMYPQWYGSNTSVHSSVMVGLLENDPLNEVATRYVWNKLSVRERSENLLEVIQKFEEKDFRYSLLSSLHYEQQQTVFREWCFPILRDMLDDWFMQEHFFPTALHVLNVMSPNDFSNVMHTVLRKMEGLSRNTEDGDEENYSRCGEIKKYKLMFKQLWQRGSKYINVCLNSKSEMFMTAKWLRELVIFLLSSKRDMDLVQLVLDNFDAEEKKIMMFSWDICSGGYEDIIENYEWDLLELLIKCTLSKEDIDLLKHTFLKEFKISEGLVYQNEWNKLDSFLKWALSSEAEVAEFKQRTAHVECLNLPERSLTENYFRDLENHLKWCANDDPEIIEQLKAEACKLDDNKALIVHLIKDSKFELLDRILNFRFSNNQQRIAQFKRPELLNRKTGFPLDKLDEFVDWCFTDAHEVQEFKKWMLCKFKCEKFLCPVILNKGFRQADEFINWCLDSMEEATMFKKMYMLSRNMEDILYVMHTTTHSMNCSHSSSGLILRWKQLRSSRSYFLTKHAHLRFSNCWMTLLAINLQLEMTGKNPSTIATAIYMIKTTE